MQPPDFPQGSSPDSGTSLSSRDATPSGRDEQKEEKEQEEEESGEEEEESEEDESGGEEEEEEEEDQGAKEKEEVAVPARIKKPMFLLRRLVSATNRRS